MDAALPVGGQGFAGRWLVLLVLAALNLSLAFVVSGSFTAIADVIAPLTGHFLGLGIAASLAVLFPRRRLTVLALGAAVTLGVHGWLGTAHCCRAPVPAAATGLTKVAAHPAAQTLTVLTLNTWHAQTDTTRLAAYLETAPADVVILSEFGPNKRPLLARVRGPYPHQVDCADWACSLALLSRVPFEQAGVGRIVDGHSAFVWARLGGAVTVVGTHLHRPSRDPWLHERQMAALAQLVRHIEGPLVLAGDFNTSPWSHAFRLLRATTTLAPASVLLPSWPAWPLPQVALDHIFLSPELRTVARGTGPPVGSDHLPVWAQLEYRPIQERGHPPGRPSGLAAAGAHLGRELLADLGGEHLGASDLRR